MPKLNGDLAPKEGAAAGVGLRPGWDPVAPGPGVAAAGVFPAPKLKGDLAPKVGAAAATADGAGWKMD